MCLYCGYMEWHLPITARITGTSLAAYWRYQVLSRTTWSFRFFLMNACGRRPWCAISSSNARCASAAAIYSLSVREYTVVVGDEPGELSSSSMRACGSVGVGSPSIAWCWTRYERVSGGARLSGRRRNKVSSSSGSQPRIYRRRKRVLRSGSAMIESAERGTYSETRTVA
jgi:hypothetical protein